MFFSACSLLKNWMAYENYPQNWRAKESKTILFPERSYPQPKTSMHCVRYCKSAFDFFLKEIGL